MSKSLKNEMTYVPRSFSNYTQSDQIRCRPHEVLFSHYLPNEFRTVVFVFQIQLNLGWRFCASKMHLGSSCLGCSPFCGGGFVVVHSLLIDGPIVGFCACSMFCCALLCVLSCFAIILMGKRELAALLCLSSWCLVIGIALWHFLTVPLVGLQCVIVVFPDHTHFSDLIRLRSSWSESSLGSFCYAVAHYKWLYGMCTYVAPG